MNLKDQKVQTKGGLEVHQETRDLGNVIKVHPGPGQRQNLGPALEALTMERIHQRIKNLVEVLLDPGQDPSPEKMIRKKYQT